jgi:hypothetical protein
MNMKINLWIIAILVFSAAAFAATQVVIGVEGTVTDIDTGQLLKNGYVQLQVTDMSGGIPATNGGLVTPQTDSTGKFSTLVGGGANALELSCGTQYNLDVSVCTDGTSSCATKASVGSYKFTACYGTQTDFNVPGALIVGTGPISLNGKNIFSQTISGTTLNINPLGGYSSVVFNTGSSVTTTINGNLTVSGDLIVTGNLVASSNLHNDCYETTEADSTTNTFFGSIDCPTGYYMAGLRLKNTDTGGSGRFKLYCCRV